MARMPKIYKTVIAAYRGIGLKMEGIPVDDQGMRVDLLAEKLVAPR